MMMIEEDGDSFQAITDHMTASAVDEKDIEHRRLLLLTRDMLSAIHEHCGDGGTVARTSAGINMAIHAFAGAMAMMYASNINRDGGAPAAELAGRMVNRLLREHFEDWHDMQATGG